MADVRVVPNVALSDGSTPSQIAAVDASGRLSVSLTAASATVTVDSELPTAAALADGAANPTTPTVGAAGLTYNGSTWDRRRSVVAAQDTTGTGIAAAGILGQLDDTATATVTENQFAPVRISTRRALLVEGVASGTAISTSVTGTVTVDSELPTAAALADNTANPTVPAVGSFGMVYDGSTWDRQAGNSAGGTYVQGPAASDAAIAGNPLLSGGRASDAVPTAVSADGDAVAGWNDRRGARKIVMVDDAGDSAMDGTNNALRVNIVAGAAGGVTHTDDAAFTPATDDGVPMFAFADETGTDTVDEGDAGAVRMDTSRRLLVRVVGATDGNRLDIDASGRPTVNVNGTVTVDSELPSAAALADATANPTVPGVGGFLMGYNGTTWDRVRTANTGRLQVDVITGGGSDTPTTPVNSYDTSASIAAGATDNHDTADLGGNTRKLTKVVIGASVALKGEIQSVINGSGTTIGVIFSPAGGTAEWEPPHRDYASVAFSANAGFDGFRVIRTNLDASEAADVYSNLMYEA